MTREGSAASQARNVPRPISMPSSPAKFGAAIVVTTEPLSRSMMSTEPSST